MRFYDKFRDYELLDMANGEKLERWGDYILIRPDPQIIWKQKENPKLWNMAHARYIRSNTGGGHWEIIKKLPSEWKIRFEDLTFNVKPMGFKHTGLFPEQAINWEYTINKIKEKSKEYNKNISVLNLFAYTGAASVAAAYAGADVCHVDASAGMVLWAKENLKSSGLADKKVRFLVDDVLKFLDREIRRGHTYDVIIMDPPSYGRGKNGEVWSIEKDFFDLITKCNKLLSDKPLFIMINTYTGGFSPTIIKNSLNKAINTKKIKNIISDEIGIKQKDRDIYLPCGMTTICEF